MVERVEDLDDLALRDRPSIVRDETAAPLLDAECLFLALRPYPDAAVRNHLQSDRADVDMRDLGEELIESPSMIDENVDAY